MSINDFLNKIKGQIGIDGNTILILLILVFVGFGSFGLGRLSGGESFQNRDIKLDNANAISVKEVTRGERMYVASKNGKLYYGLGCSGASRILAKNEVWFASKEDAEKSGYTLSTSCK